MNRKRFVSWGIVGLLALQIVLFAVSFTKTTPSGPGFVLWDVMMSEAILVNEIIEFLLPVGLKSEDWWLGLKSEDWWLGLKSEDWWLGLKSEDWWLGLAAMPVVYYATAVVVAASGRATYRIGRQRLG